MPFDALVTARDWALILLALEMLLLGLLPLVILYRAARGLRQLVPRIAAALRLVAEKTHAISSWVTRMLAGVRAPLVWVTAALNGVCSWAKRLRRDPLSRR